MAFPQYKGVNVPIFTGQPTWDARVTVVPAYRTTLFEALDTSEERHSQLPRPLYRIRYRTLTLTANETAYLRKVIELAKEMPIGVPIWPMRTKLTANASAGATSLTVDDVKRRLWDVFHQYALIWRDYDTWEVIDMSSAAGTVITLNAGTTGSWQVGDTVVPLLFGHLGRESFQSLTDENAQVEVNCSERFHGIHGQDVPESESVLCNIVISADGGGTTFDCHAGNVLLNNKGGGTYFSGSWLDSRLYIGIQDEDTFDIYQVDAPLNGGTHGEVWAGDWVDELLFQRREALDTLDTYTGDTDMNTLNGGDGFDAAWVDSTLG